MKTEGELSGIAGSSSSGAEGHGASASRLAAFTEFRKISALIVNKLPEMSHWLILWDTEA